MNEYFFAQGIRPHVDRIEFFDDNISVVLFGGDCVLDFAPVNAAAGRVVQEVCVPRRSYYCLSGPSRFQWTHGIRPLREDVVGGRRVKRVRRVSLTFRKVLSDAAAGAVPWVPGGGAAAAAAAGAAGGVAPCRNWARDGQCRYESRCRFAYAQTPQL